MGRKEVPIGGGGNISKRTASRTACVSSMPSKERSGYPQGRSMRDVSSGVGAKLTKRRSDICSACMSCMRITKKKWFRTGKRYWLLVQWRWKGSKIKKGLLYRLRKMYVYRRRAKKWFRTRRFYWRRIKRKEGSTGWMWMGAPKKTKGWGH